jgi:hypothetical protein
MKAGILRLHFVPLRMKDDHGARTRLPASQTLLLNEGATMGYKVYVVLTTANERGSNAVTITHDAG